MLNARKKTGNGAEPLSARPGRSTIFSLFKIIFPLVSEEFIKPRAQCAARAGGVDVACAAHPNARCGQLTPGRARQPCQTSPLLFGPQRGFYGWSFPLQRGDQKPCQHYESRPSAAVTAVSNHGSGDIFSRDIGISAAQKSLLSGMSN